MRRVMVQAIFGVGLFVVTHCGAFGQQTIINVPSDALTPKGAGFYLHESAFTGASPGARYTTTNFWCYGLSDRTELCATLYNIDDVGSPDGCLGLGYKSVEKLFEDELPEAELKWTHGFMLPVRLNDGAQAVGYFPYTHLAVNIPNTPFRILGGAAIGSENLLGQSTASAIAGLEFPITKRLSFTGEWFSGNHNFSALIPGFTWHSERLIVVHGLKIPNDFDRREYGYIFEVGVFFGKKSSDASTPWPHYGVFNTP